MNVARVKATGNATPTQHTMDDPQLRKALREYEARNLDKGRARKRDASTTVWDVLNVKFARMPVEVEARRAEERRLLDELD